MPSWFETSWFDYPVTRNISLPPGSLRHFNITVFVMGILYAIAITIINVVAVGYEAVSITSQSYTAAPLWYERITPKSSLVLPSYSCEDSFIKPNQGQLFLYFH